MSHAFRVSTRQQSRGSSEYYFAMKKPDQPTAAVPQTSTPASPHRTEQAQEIMRQLVAEGIFSEDEAAEIQFSDATVIRTPSETSKR